MQTRQGFEEEEEEEEEMRKGLDTQHKNRRKCCFNVLNHNYQFIFIIIHECKYMLIVSQLS